MDNTQLNTENSAPWQCTLDTRNFANGTHTLRAVAYNSAGASTTITRTVNVQNASGPTGVAFAAPAAGATISGSFSASSGCQVSGTGIVQVVFFMDNTQLNTDNSAPWQCTLDTRSFANGTHTLRAVAYNSAGASTTVTRSVNVQNVSGPTGVTFTAPAAGATISGSFSASSACQVSGTGIVRVVFFMDNTQLNTENSAPWQCTLDTRNFANGTHTLRAVAYDSAGASTTVTRSVNVQNMRARPRRPRRPRRPCRPRRLRRRRRPVQHGDARLGCRDAPRPQGLSRLFRYCSGNLLAGDWEWAGCRQRYHLYRSGPTERETVLLRGKGLRCVEQ